MAELEALYSPPDRTGDIKQAGWRKELPPDKPFTLGRVAGIADWCVEEDSSISRVNANLLWDGSRLRVEQITERKTSDVVFKNQPADKFAVAAGESFVIGTTRFTLHDGPGGASTAPPSKFDTVVPTQAARSRDDLRDSPFDNSEIVLRALEELPDILRLVTEDDRLLKKLVDILLKAIGQADAAAVVQLPPEATKAAPRVSVLTHKMRQSSADDRFTPSRGLAYRALREERKSVLWTWKTDPSGPPAAEFTLRVSGRPGTPWAICTPFRDDSGLGLYVDGVSRAAGPAADRELTGYQKVVELVASIIEATRKSHALERMLAVYSSYLPSAVRNVADPYILKDLLKPRVARVTVLFCDLRGSCKIAEAGAEALYRTWEGVADALDQMAQIITMNGGVVAGFQGDAVMAFWGWPEDQPDQVELAARTALQIRERFDPDGWFDDMGCGVGIAHGEAVAGKLGTHDLAKIDVFGPVVNLASRLESMTKPFGVRMIIDEASAAAIAPAIRTRKVRGRTRKLAVVLPAGMTVPQTIYELLPPLEASYGGRMPEATRSRWEQVVDSFAAGKWADVRGDLDEYFPDDPTGNLLAAFMAKHNHAPPAGWAGVIPLEAK